MVSFPVQKFLGLNREEVDLKLNIQKTKILASGSITSWQTDVETMTDYFLGLQSHCKW